MLTDAKIRNAKALDKPQKLFDAGGLFALLTPLKGSGTSKRWRFKFSYQGREKLLSFGVGQHGVLSGY